MRKNKKPNRRLSLIADICTITLAVVTAIYLVASLILVLKKSWMIFGLLSAAVYLLELVFVAACDMVYESCKKENKPR